MADNSSSGNAIEIFYSYSHRDEDLRDELEKHLSILQRQGIINNWHDRRIGPGKEWESQISGHLESAHIILLLLSADFIASDYCYDIEMTRAMQRHEDDDAIVIPVMLRPVDIKGAPFAKLQGLPTDFKAVTTWDNQDEAFKDIAQGIRRTIAEFIPDESQPTGAQILRLKRKVTLPPIWNIGQRRNRNFTGREELFIQLRQSLTSGEHAAVTQAIKGLGGVGKTQVALEYAYRHAGDYDTVWWVHAENTAALAEEFAALAVRLNLPEKDATKRQVTIDAVKHWLEQHTNWLLVFDNVPEPPDVEKYLLQGRTGHTIITSRYQAWGEHAAALSLDVMLPAEAVAFLLKRSTQTDRQAAEKLAKELGHFPLALEQAGAYAETAAISLSAYLKLYLSRGKELWADQPPPSGYEHTVATTWAVSLDVLREESPAALALLNLCAFMAPDNIPLDVIQKGAEFLPEPLAETAQDGVAFNKITGALLQYSLVKREEDMLSLHRLVQQVVRDRLSEEEQKTWAAAAVEILNEAIPQKSQDVRTWTDCARLLPHALAATVYTEKYGVAAAATGRLLNQCGGYLRGRALFAEAKKNYERALAIDEKTYGKNHPEVATDLNNLGGVLQDLGDLAGAKKNFERALEIDEKTYGENLPDVATDLNNLGGVLQELGDLAGAKKNFERALEIGVATLGENHPTVAIRLNNLGTVLKDLGDLAGAKENFERALKIGFATLGENHPTVALRLNNLGLVLYASGDLAGAKKNYERALAIFMEFLGKDHPNTKIVRQHLEDVNKEIDGQ